MVANRATSPRGAGCVLALAPALALAMLSAAGHAQQPAADEGRVVLRYVDEAGDRTDAANPNGAQRNIAGITDATGRILGMMPHPERLYEAALGGTDGRRIFESAVISLTADAA